MANRPSIQELQDFEALREASADLARHSADSDIFCTIPWFGNLAQTGFAPNARLHLFLVNDTESSSLFCLPLARSPEAPHALASLSNYYSSLFGPIGDASRATAGAWNALCRTLRKAHPCCAIIQIHPLATSGPAFLSLPPALRSAGYWVDTYFCFGNWYLPVAGRAFDQYFGSLPSQLRNTVLRGRKKLENAGKWQVVIHSASDATLDPAIADFESVYRKSWKEPETFPHFIGGLCRTAAAQGWLRLGILKLDGEAIAAQLWLVNNQRALIYKLAYDSRYTRLSAGSVLTAELMKHVLDHDGVTEVDYLTGDDAYKKDWMSHRRERHGIVAFNPQSWRGLLCGARHYLGKWVKRQQSRASS